MAEEKKEKNPVVLRREIDGSFYTVRIHFNEIAKEDMKSKIKKLMVKELNHAV